MAMETDSTPPITPTAATLASELKGMIKDWLRELLEENPGLLEAGIREASKKQTPTGGTDSTSGKFRPSGQLESVVTEWAVEATLFRPGPRRHVEGHVAGAWRRGRGVQRVIGWPCFSGG